MSEETKDTTVTEDTNPVTPEDKDKDNDEDEYEKVCYLCRRPESKAGKMITMPGNICLCVNCLQKSFDQASMMPMPSLNGMDISTILGNMGGQNPKIPGQNGTHENTQKTENQEQTENPGQMENSQPAGQQGTPIGNIFGNQLPPGVSAMMFSPDDLQHMFGGIPAPKKVKKSKKEELPQINIKDIPTPSEIHSRLDEYIIGQDYAKKCMAVAVYNHYKRVACQADDIEIEKSNMLMIGPTGCGKTYLVKTLAKLLDVPLAIADATSLTEAGYIGDDIESVVTKLLAAADNDVAKAERGIIFIDEIDKLARKRNATQRDVSGESVQQGLLKMLEGAEIEVPVGANSKNAMVPMETVNTKNILFICGGAFPDLENIIKERLEKKTTMGFGAELKDTFDHDKDILSKVEVEDIRKFGMIPEFIGRLPVIFTLKPMDKDMLVKVLKEPKNAIIKQYQKLLALDEVDLQFTEGAYEAIAEKAIQRDTGARALRSIIEAVMLDIMYEIPKDPNIGKVTLTREYVEGTGGPQIEMRGSN